MPIRPAPFRVPPQLPTWHASRAGIPTLKRRKQRIATTSMISGLPGTLQIETYGTRRREGTMRTGYVTHTAVMGFCRPGPMISYCS